MSDEQNKASTLKELCEFIVKHADSIYIRALVNYQWKNVPLAEAPTEQALKWALEWVSQRQEFPRIAL